MKINLKKAAAIIENLHVKSSHIVAVDTITLSEYDNVSEIIQTSKEKLLKNKELALDVIETIYSIRRKVDAVNRQIGISDILNEIALCNRKISILEIFSNEDRVETDVEALKLKVEKLSQPLPNGSYNLNNRISTFLHTKESIENAKAEKLTLTRKVNQLKDTLLAYNVSNFIELSEKEVVLLEGQGLI